MRIAFFTETFLPKLDGIVTVLCLLLDHLTERGIETLVIAPRVTAGTLTHYRQTPVITVPGLPLPVYPEIRTRPAAFNTLRHLRAFQPDVVHFVHPAMLGCTGMLMAKALHVPMLASFHLDLGTMARHHNVAFLADPIDWVTAILFNWADYTLAPSRAVQTRMQAMGIQREIGLWGRGVDAERFNPCFRDSAMRDLLSDGQSDATLLIYVGRLSQEKQLHTLREVLDQVPNTRLALVGDGPYRAALEAHFAGYPVKFMGYMRGEALSQAYASADVFVFPSALESFGLVVTEAMAAGLPVVASQVGGVRDVVQEGITGYTFPAGDVAAMIEGVRKVTVDRATLQQMAVAAREYAESQTWAAKMDEVIDHYQRLIEQTKR